MIHLNLIPDAQRERLKRERLFLFVHTITGYLVVAIAVATILITASRFMLISHFNKLRSNTSLVNIEHQVFQNNIEEINYKLSVAQSVQKNFSKFSTLIYEVTKLIPEGVILTFVTVDRATGAFRITGIAPTRDALTQTKERLENSRFVTELQAPLSNFLEKEDVDFRFAGKLNVQNFTLPPK